MVMAEKQKNTKFKKTGSNTKNPDDKGNLGILRAMPESLSAEAAVLGSMIIDPQCIGMVLEHLKRDAFYRYENQEIYEALVNLYEKNKGSGIDAVLLRDELLKRGLLDEVGGVDYIARILDSVPSSANVEYYTGILKDKMLLRELIGVSSKVLEMAYEQTGEVREVLDEAESAIFAVTDKNIERNGITAMKDLVVQSFELIEKRQGTHVTGLSTGYYELDDLTCGLQNGEMIIIAGRPSMGKTSFALNVAENIALNDKMPVAVFSLEMGRQQLAERFLCSVSRIDSQHVRRGLLSEEDFRKLADASNILAGTPIYIDDTSSLTPLEVRAKARRLKGMYNIKCIVIDYLQLMHLDSSRSDSRQQEITTISRYLKGIARELNIPVIVLSQLNRSVEGREGHKPKMSDLRESGSIEQDADVIVLLHREDYYHRGETDYQDTNTAEIIIAKQRNGPTGVINLTFLDKITRFENASRIEEPAGGVPF